MINILQRFSLIFLLKRAKIAQNSSPTAFLITKKITYNSKNLRFLRRKLSQNRWKNRRVKSMKKQSFLANLRNRNWKNLKKFRTIRKLSKKRRRNLRKVKIFFKISFCLKFALNYSKSSEIGCI